MPLLPSLGDPATQGARRFGAMSDSSIVIAELLTRHVPAIKSGELVIVAIARRPTVLSKVVIRRTWMASVQSARPVALTIGISGDYIRRLRQELSGERIHIVQWHRDPMLLRRLWGLTRHPRCS